MTTATLWLTGSTNQSRQIANLFNFYILSFISMKFGMWTANGKNKHLEWGQNGHGFLFLPTTTTQTTAQTTAQTTGGGLLLPCYCSDTSPAHQNFAAFISTLQLISSRRGAPFGDNDLWYHHIPGTLCSFSLSFSFFPPSSPPPSPTSQLALPAGLRALPKGFRALLARSDYFSQCCHVCVRVRQRARQEFIWAATSFWPLDFILHWMKFSWLYDPRA